jgi:uncharacterized protein YbjT (DUF2867 family)
MLAAMKCLAFAVAFAACAALAAVSGCAGSGGSREQQTVVVAGATGGTGREVVMQALGMGYRVRVIVRDQPKAEALFGDRVTYVVANVRDSEALPAAIAGADYVVSALGSNSRREPENKPEYIDYGAVKALADAARNAGARQFVLVSSMGVTDPDHMLNKILDNILAWKLKGENAVRDAGVPYTIVRPGGLRDGPAGVGGIRVIQGDPKDVTGQIARADVAAVCVHALGNPQARNVTLAVLGVPGTAPPDWKTFFSGLQPDVR